MSVWVQGNDGLFYNRPTIIGNGFIIEYNDKTDRFWCSFSVGLYKLVKQTVGGFAEIGFPRKIIKVTYWGQVKDTITKTHCVPCKFIAPLVVSMITHHYDIRNQDTMWGVEDRIIMWQWSFRRDELIKVYNDPEYQKTHPFLNVKTMQATRRTIKRYLSGKGINDIFGLEFTTDEVYVMSVRDLGYDCHFPFSG